MLVTVDMRACVPYFIATKKHKGDELGYSSVHFLIVLVALLCGYDSLRGHERLQL